MNRPLQIELLPLGQVLQLECAEQLQDMLFALGVEFPCGGRGKCRGCKIRDLSGRLPITDTDRSCLIEEDLAAGWRLACRAIATTDLKLEVAQWHTTILSDNSSFEFKPREGLGIAVDLGTTTIVAQVLDLQTGAVLAVRSSLNAQARHGADIMSRVEYAVMNHGQMALQDLVRRQIGSMLHEALLSARNSHVPAGAHSFHRRKLESIVLVGNTVMHHLFSGLPLKPLAEFPFLSPNLALQTFRASELGWDLGENPAVYFLPCLGGFVGSDLLAGILATKLDQQNRLTMLMDLGTNGELVLGNKDHLLCAATAAGPAFEGARISAGMRAATGAISQVQIAEGRLCCHVLGNTSPRGICGSGLVDAAASALQLGWIKPNGRIANGRSIDLLPPVALQQQDIRELQLAKGAIAAGAKILIARLGVTEDDIEQLYLAGAFGNYINISNARRIGLLNLPEARIKSAGNTALLGAKIALFNLPQSDPSYPELTRRAVYLSLNEVPDFQDLYAEAMGFPMPA